MALSVCVLHQYEFARRDVPHLAVARLVFDRPGQSDSQYPRRNGVALYTGNLSAELATLRQRFVLSGPAEARFS